MSDPERWIVWMDDKQDDTTIFVFDTSGGTVCRQPWHDEGLRRARLIAAAPDLCRELERLVAILSPLEHSGALQVPGLATLNGARNALAKAGGDDDDER